MIYQIENLHYHYDSGPEVLRDISFCFNEGSILTILGPNGAGKSTLLNCLAGLLKPTSGEICLNGKPLNHMKPREIAQIVGYVQQNHIPTFAYTVLHFVIMGRAANISLFGKPKAADMEAGYEALRELGIEHLANKPYTEISGGERQQATIARALIQKPKVLLFDEPTAHLDFGNQIRTLNMINSIVNKGYSVIMTTHNPDHALLLNSQAAIIGHDGRMHFGPSCEIVTEQNLFDIYHAGIRILNLNELSRSACVTPRLSG